MFYSTDYLFFSILIFIIILFFSISLEKNIKIILGNYILIALTLSVSYVVDALFYFLQNIQSILPIQGLGAVYSFLVENKTILNLLLYFVILTLVFLKSQIGIGDIENKFVKILAKSIITPLGVLLTVTTLQIVVYGYKMFDVANVMDMAKNFNLSKISYYFFVFSPVWIIFAGLVVVLFSLKIEFKISFKKGGSEAHNAEGGH